MTETERKYNLTIIISALVTVFLITCVTILSINMQNAAERRATLQLACMSVGGNWNDVRVECVDPEILLPVPPTTFQG